MMFFYGIEQLFLNTVMGSDSVRGYTTIAFIVSLLIFDIPTGIFADKIGRKKSMLLACICAGISLVILGISQNLATYIIGILFFGLYVALTNGASQALLYDWLAEQNQTKRYAKYQGNIYAYFLIGATFANIASGFIANALGLRSTYFLSIIPACVLAFFILYKTHEPPLKKKHAQAWFTHLKEVVQEIKVHRGILVYSVRFIVGLLIINTIWEFGQIYILSFGVTTVLLGILWAVAYLSAATGRLLAHYVQNYPRTFILSFCVVLGIFSLVTSSFGIALFCVAFGLVEALGNIAETEIQHSTSSNIRATTFSVISFIGNALAIPIVFMYTKLFESQGIFMANKIVLYCSIVLLLLTVLIPVKQALHADTD